MAMQIKLFIVVVVVVVVAGLFIGTNLCKSLFLGGLVSKIWLETFLSNKFMTG